MKREKAREFALGAKNSLNGSGGEGPEKRADGALGRYRRGTGEAESRRTVTERVEGFAGSEAERGDGPCSGFKG